MGSRACSGGGLEWAGLLLLCCSVVLLSLTGAGRAILGCTLGASGRHGPQGAASGPMLLRLQLMLCTVSGVFCCRTWKGLGVRSGAGCLGEESLCRVCSSLCGCAAGFALASAATGTLAAAAGTFWGEVSPVNEVADRSWL